MNEHRHTPGAHAIDFAEYIKPKEYTLDLFGKYIIKVVRDKYIARVPLKSRAHRGFWNFN